MTQVPETGENLDSILHASANGYLTQEEVVQLIADMNSGKFMYDPLREDLKRLPENIAVLTTPYCDYIAFRDAETWGDYAIAAASVLPFAKYIKVAGKVVKVAQTLVKEAEVAYKAANVADSGATNAVTNPKLNAQLTAQEIANGHGFEKHVIQQGEFSGLGIRTKEQYQQHVEKVINNATDVRYYSDGRVAYLDPTTRTVVIRNTGKGESTAFRPDYDVGWDNYINRLPVQNIPFSKQ